MAISNFTQTKSLFSENISNNCSINIAFTLKIRIFVLFKIISYPHFFIYLFISIRRFINICIFLSIVMYSLAIIKAIKRLSVN